MKGSFPLVPSVFVYATVWGGLARQAGLSLGEIALMCLIVTAGASPVLAVPMNARRLPALGGDRDDLRREHAPLPDGGDPRARLSRLPAPLAGAHRPRRQRRVLRPGCRAPEPTRPLGLSGARRWRGR